MTYYQQNKLCHCVNYTFYKHWKAKFKWIVYQYNKYMQTKTSPSFIYKTKYSELYLACSIRHSYFGEESNMPIFIIINIKYGKLLKKISAQGVSKSCDCFNGSDLGWEGVVHAIFFFLHYTYLSSLKHLQIVLFKI